MATEISNIRKKPWYKKWWGILIIIFLVFGFIGAILDDSERSENKGNNFAQNNQSNMIGSNSESSSSFDEDVPTKLQALNKCYKKAKECSDGMFAVETEFRSTCFQIWSYTSDSEEDILDLASIGDSFC